MNIFPRVALVTGGGRGIGQAIALELGRNGATVAINYLKDKKSAEKTVGEIKKHGGNAEAIQANVTKDNEVEKLINTVINHFGKIDILVNNAGTIKDSLVIRMDIDDFDDVIDVHLRGTFLCTRLALRSMIKNRWGRVINIGSVVGIAGNVGQSNYSAAKAAIIGLTKTIAKEVATRKITVNCIAPGFITTDIVKGLSPEMTKKILDHVAMGRFGEPGEVAKLTGFIASEEAAYITGQTIAIDGGLVLG